MEAASETSTDTGGVSSVAEDEVSQAGSDVAKPQPHHKMGVVTTALFIVGEMAGGGIVALPLAMLQASYLGIVFVVLGAIMSAFTGIQLGHCWSILLARQSNDTAQPNRKPYPTIARIAVGRKTSFLVSLSIDITLFGVSTVFLLLASENIETLLNKWADTDVSFCLWILVVGAFLLPITFLATPKDFWPLAIAAMAGTAIASVLIFSGSLLDLNSSSLDQSAPELPTFESISLSFATIIFSYGGHAAFPTIQHDMKDPDRFPESIKLAYGIIICMYLPVSLVAFLVYGNGLATQGGNVLFNIENDVIQQIVIVLITMHVITSFVIVMNPLNQELEELLKLPHKFGISRVLLRSGTMIAIIFVAETVPHFGNILNLIGGSTVVALTFIFPGIFFCSLNMDTVPDLYLQPVGFTARLTDLWSRLRSSLPWHEIMVNAVIISIGILAGIASTYAALKSFVNPSGNLFTVPCYVNWTAAH